MAVTTAQLIALAKEAADLTNVADYVTDATWVDWLNAGVKELHRLVTGKFKDTYFRTHDFTLTAGQSQVALPSDFWKIKGLDIDPGTPRRREVRRFNFAERNKFRANNLRDLDPARYCTDRWYNVVGSGLMKIEAEEQSAGNYRLYYVPKPVTLTLSTDRSFSVDSADTDPPSGSPDYGRWVFANGNFTTLDVGARLTPTFGSPNAAFNVPFTVVSVVNGTTVNVTPDPSDLGSFTNPASGTVAVDYSNALDTELEPFAEYVWLTAAIKSLVKEESFAQAKVLADQRNLIRDDMAEAVEQDQAGPLTIIDTDEDGGGWD